MKKMFIDPEMGAAGDMMAAAFLDMFENPEEIIKMINKGIKEAGLDEVIASIIKEQAGKEEGLGFDVDVHGEKEGPHHHHGPHRGPCRRRPPMDPSINITIEGGINVNLNLGEPKRCKKKHHHHHHHGHHHGPKMRGAKARKARPPKPSSALHTSKDHLI